MHPGEETCAYGQSGVSSAPVEEAGLLIPGETGVIGEQQRTCKRPRVLGRGNVAGDLLKAELGRAARDVLQQVEADLPLEEADLDGLGDPVLRVQREEDGRHVDVVYEEELELGVAVAVDRGAGRLVHARVVHLGGALGELLRPHAHARRERDGRGLRPLQHAVADLVAVAEARRGAQLRVGPRRLEQLHDRRHARVALLGPPVRLQVEVPEVRFVHARLRQRHGHDGRLGPLHAVHELDQGVHKA